MSFSRDWLVDLLTRLGYPDAADEAARTLPDSFDMERLVKFGDQHGIDRGELIDRMGGSP
jgi:hypothetical protein